MPCGALSGAEKSSATGFVPQDHPLRPLVESAGLCLGQEEAFTLALEGSAGLKVTFSIEAKPCSLWPACKTATYLFLQNVQLISLTVSFHEGAASDFVKYSPQTDTIFKLYPSFTLMHTSNLRNNRVLDYLGLLPIRHQATSFVDERDSFTGLASRAPKTATCGTADLLGSENCKVYLTYTLNPTSSTVTYHRKYKNLAETLRDRRIQRDPFNALPIFV